MLLLIFISHIMIPHEKEKEYEKPTKNERKERKERIEHVCLLVRGD